MQIFICPECSHKSVFDPWVESAHCPRCGYTPVPYKKSSEGFTDQGSNKIPIAREAITQIYHLTKQKPGTRPYLIMVRRDDDLYTFGRDARQVINVLGAEAQVNEIFDGVTPPTARIPYEDRFEPMRRMEAAGFPIGLAQSGILTCPQCGRQNVTKDIYFPSYRCQECNYIPPERDRLVKSWLKKGIQAVEEESRKEAQFALNQVLHHEGTAVQQATALFWLAKATPDLYQKREYLKKALALNPSEVALVDSIQGTLAQVDRIIAGQPAQEAAQQEVEGTSVEQLVQATRHNCPRCGGDMRFSPEQHLLICESCQNQQVPRPEQLVPQEQSFREAMATLKGHNRPVKTRSLACSACGAVFLLAPTTLSQSCPYCASDYTLAGETSRALIPPTALIPFKRSQSEAQKQVSAWFHSKELPIPKGLRSPLGIYLPLWTFDLGGHLHVTKPGLLFSQSRTHTVFFDDILVFAVRKLPTALVTTPSDFCLQDMIPFHHDYLVDWPAETYDISLSDAALISRSAALDSYRDRHQLAKNVQIRTSMLQVESFKLILAPMWIAQFNQEDKHYRVIVHGRSGIVRIIYLGQDNAQDEEPYLKK